MLPSMYFSIIFKGPEVQQSNQLPKLQRKDDCRVSTNRRSAQNERLHHKPVAQWQSEKSCSSCQKVIVLFIPQRQRLCLINVSHCFLGVPTGKSQNRGILIIGVQVVARLLKKDRNAIEMDTKVTTWIQKTAKRLWTRTLGCFQ